MAFSRKRLTVGQGLLYAFPIVALYAGAALAVLAMLPQRAWALKGGYLITFGLFNTWRYLWGGTLALRSFIFEHYVFPARRKQAEALPEAEKYPERLYIVIATYREQPWITRRMLRSVLRSASRIPSKTTIYVSTGSDAEDAVVAGAIKDHPFGNEFEIILMRQKGKRTALTYALRSIARRCHGETSSVVLMDGDTAVAEDVFEKTLPLFKLDPKLGAITTNNIALTEGAPWYRDWYNLRFAMRHRHMNATSLSDRVLALTGRFSLFRTDLAISEELIAALEDDHIDHWYYGRIKFVTGDDKSTWYVLLKNGWHMSYVPDAMVYCLESSSDEPFKQAFSKMARWFGNMLRNNWRSIKLGPKPMGLFTWWCLVDQRISIWTTLVGPTSAILLGIFSSFYYVIFYLVIMVLVRCLYLLFTACDGHRVVLRDLPLICFTQWAGSVMKIKVLANLGRQSWGKRTGKDAANQVPFALRFMEQFQPLAWTLLFIVFLGCLLRL